MIDIFSLNDSAKNVMDMFSFPDRSYDIHSVLSSLEVRGNISTINLLILPILFNYFD